MSAIEEVYSNSFLNATLARWMSAPSDAPVLDCAGCTKPAKCCAFQPFVPNFLLGGWLGDREELPSIENVYFHPAGAVATPAYRTRHLSSLEHGVDQLCGFFDRAKRSCTLWNFRPGECSTYFCDEARLSAPRMALSQRSFAVEVAVAQMALVELGFSAEEISRQVDVVNGEAHEVGKYTGAELLMMYKKAWNWSQGIDRQTVHNWLEAR